MATGVLAEPWILTVGMLVSGYAVFSREAMAEFSFSDGEELLRKRNQTKDLLPQLERFAESIRETRFGFRVLDYVGRGLAVAALAGWLAGSSMAPELTWVMLMLGLLGQMFILDVLLRPLAEAAPEAISLRLLPLWRLTAAVLFLPVLPLRTLHHAIERMTRSGDGESPEEQAEDEIMAAVSLSEFTGQIDEELRDMIESVLGLGGITVDRLMTPRTDMHAVDRDDGIEVAVELAQTTGFSRLPIYEGNRDNVVGVCYVKDLVGVHPDELPKLDDVMRPPVFVPASKRVAELLKDFRSQRIHLAIVLDEYGGTAGLISFEDIIEEVFGDIDDEFDEVDEAEVQAVGESVWELDARFKVDDANEDLDLNLPESERYESLGGLITSELGHIPEVGAVWEHDEHRMTVLESTDRRVVRVRLERVAEDREARA